MAKERLWLFGQVWMWEVTSCRTRSYSPSMNPWLIPIPIEEVWSARILDLASFWNRHWSEASLDRCLSLW